MSRVANPNLKRQLVLMVGLPYSGKTAQLLTVEHDDLCPVVSPDAIRLALHGERFLPTAEPWVHAIARTMVNALFLAGHAKIIVDGCHGTRKRRWAWKFGQPQDCLPWKRIYCNIPTDAETCILRATEAQDEDIIPIIQRMAEQFEPVEQDEWD